MRGMWPSEAWPPESFVGRLSGGERVALLASGRHATYQPGQRLLTDGDRGGGFVILLHTGQVKVVMQEELGNESLVGIRSRGDLLGEMSYVDGLPRSASVVAINEVRASSIAWDRFESYLRDYPRVGMEIARVLVDRLRESDATSRDVRAPVPLRVAKLLQSLVDVFDSAVIPLSQAEIAQLARAAEVTVNKALREFRNRHVVRTEYRKVVVPCLDCLNRLAGRLTVDPKEGGKGVLGCGGTDAHRPQ